MDATYIETDSLARALLAESRSPDIPETEDIYGWMIGSWELDVVGHDDEGNIIHTTGEAHVGRVLEGRAVQDVFINPRRSDRGPDSPGFANWFGTTIRVYCGWRQMISSLKTSSIASRLFDRRRVGGWRIHVSTYYSQAELIRRLKQLDWIPVGIFQLDLLPARPGLHFVSEAQARLFQRLNARW